MARAGRIPGRELSGLAMIRVEQCAAESSTPAENDTVTMISYSDSEYPIRPDFAESHNRFRESLAQPGAWWTGAERIAIAREALADAMGSEALVDAAGVVSNFERMVRVADSTGISIGPMVGEDLALVHELGIDRFSARQ